MEDQPERLQPLSGRWWACVALRVLPFALLSLIPAIVWAVFLEQARVGMIVWLALGVIIPGIIAMFATR